MAEQVPNPMGLLSLREETRDLEVEEGIIREEHDNQAKAMSTCKYNNSEIWKYITAAAFTIEFLPVPADPCLIELIMLPRQRELPYSWKFWLNSGNMPSLKTLTAIALYLSGVQKNTPCGSEMGCKQARKLYDESFHYDNENNPDFHTNLALNTCVHLPGHLQKVLPHIEKRFKGYYCCNAYYRCTEELPMPEGFFDTSAMQPQDTKPPNELPEYREAPLGSWTALWKSDSGKLPNVGSPTGPGRAFSSLKTLHEEECKIDNDGTAFQILKVAGGSDRDILCSPNHALLCTVKEGSLWVNVDAQPTFTVTEDSCWNVESGEHCVVRNRRSDDDATIYVFSRRLS